MSDATAAAVPPPLNFPQVLTYETSDNWWIRVAMKLPKRWLPALLKMVGRKIYPRVKKKHRRYLDNYRLWQQQFPGAQPDVPNSPTTVGEMNQLLFEGELPTLEQFAMYELLGSEQFERLEGEAQQALGDQLEKDAARKFPLYSRILANGRQRYRRAILMR
ncbi:hypothetical protein KLP40_14870 [Hymenobacter sp. NST-14]|uniref:hypothetical protein n=1 Tax=Hymenobacter piscis TaxID=2839984 RepID=UPI001C00CA60|nr:hypothetical protein [Hymenobacter piscis]MBT9394452.1 hypothetical protein [Hymenobacter piscis]